MGLLKRKDKLDRNENSQPNTRSLRQKFMTAAKWGTRAVVYPALLLGCLAAAVATWPEQTLRTINAVARGNMLNALDEMDQSPKSSYLPLMQENHYTFFGDTNHSDAAIRDYFFGPENAENIINSSAKHVFIEYPDVLQPFADDLAAGNITRETFIRRISDNVSPLWWTEEETAHYHGLMADMILTLAENDIRFHFIDPGLGDEMGTVEQQFLFELAESMLEYMEEENPDVKTMSSEELMAHTFFFTTTRMLTDETFRDRMIQTHDWFINTRLGTDNIKIANQIREASSGEKSVILYGAAHILRDKDLDELLGADQSTVINLYGARENYADFLMAMVHKNILTENPGYVHIVQDSALYKPQPEEISPPPGQDPAGMPQVHLF